MTQAINFTKEALTRLPARSKQYDVGDSKTNALRIRVSPGGTKTFILYRRVEGRPCRITLGRFPDLTIDRARAKAASFNGRIAEGQNPQEEKRQSRAEPSFQAMVDYYYNDHALRFTRRAKEHLRVLELHVLPDWGHLKPRKISKQMARQLHHTIAAETGKDTANKAMTLARAAFNFCIAQEHYTGTNPCQGLKKFRRESRDRFLSREELSLFVDAARQEQPQHRDFFLLALFTGARKSNLLTMRYEDIDFTLRRWRIPADEAKNGETNLIALSRPALALLRWRQRSNRRSANPSPFVFPGQGKTGYMTTPRDAFNRIKKRMGATNLRIHDLRRTLGSYMAISGASLPIIGKALNHKNQSATAIYARLSHDPVQEAVDKAAFLMRQN